jgi:KUP system potassium uptake protein
MAPDWLLIPLVILATMATIIASQAVISGTYSLTRQAVQLGVFPRTHILHTSEDHIGQIYLPTINRLLLIGVCLLVLGFRSSSALAAAYGIAVTGTMALTTLLMLNVAIGLWHWKRPVAFAVIAFFLVFDLAFFGANLLKIGDGGWLPLLIGALTGLVMCTWYRGRALVAMYTPAEPQTLADFLLSRREAPRIPGTAVYLSSQRDRVPRALQLNIQHHKFLHERVIVLSIATEAEPRVVRSERVRIRELAPDILVVEARFGFMQDPSVPRVLHQCEALGLILDQADTTYFLGRVIPVATTKPGMEMWRERLFTLIAQNATSAAEFFELPPERTIELAERVAI